LNISPHNFRLGQLGSLFFRPIIETHQEYIEKFGLDIEQAKIYSYSSTKKLKFKCKECGEIVYRMMANVHSSQTIGCICSDGFSYGEKIVYSMLKQLNIPFKTQFILKCNSDNSLKNKR